MCWHTFNTHLQSKKLIIKIIFKLQTALHSFVLLLSLRMVRPAACLWHYEFIACLIQGLYKNTNKLRGCCFQDKNANKLRCFLQEPSGRILANFVRLQASLPRTSKDKPAYCCMPIIGNKKIFSRIPKCYLWQSWASDPEDSKNDPMVRAHEHQGNRETSLVVSVGHISWSMVDLLALTRQKQLAKLRQATSQPASQCQVCLFQDCLFCRNSHSAETFSVFFVTSKNETARNNLQKWNFVLSDVYIHLSKHVLNGCFENRVQKDSFANRLKCDWARKPS